MIHVVATAPDDINDVLGPNEKVELYIKEKIYAPQVNIDSLILTNERIILRHPHALRLKKDYRDYGYSDIVGVQLKKGLTRSTIKLTLKHDERPLELGKLPNSIAGKGYRIIRENIGKSNASVPTEQSKVPEIPAVLK